MNPWVQVLPFLAALVILCVIYHFYKRSKARKTERAFAGREDLDEGQFYEKYFESRGIPFHIVSGVRRALEESLDADLSRLAPEDRFAGELEFFFYSDSLAEVDIVIELEKEFGIEIPDDEVKKIRTVNDIVETVWAKVRQKPA